MVIHIGSFFVFCLLKVPVAFALAASSILTMVILDIPLTTVANQLYRGLDMFALLAVPFFMLSGQIMNDGKVTDRLIKLSRALVGHVKGGLAHVNVVVSMIFAGISGSSAADTVGIGSVLIPAMKAEGYDMEFTVAITCASSTMGVIIPPSIYMVVYGAMAGVSIAGLFLGGVIPGVLIGLSQMVVSYYRAIKRNYPTSGRFSLSNLIEAFKVALIPLGMPLVIVGGVITGVFTATEASVISVVYGLAIIYLVYHSLPLRELPGVFLTAARFYASAMFAITTAQLFGWVIAYLRGPEMVAGLLGASSNPVVVLSILVVILLIVGTFMSPVAAIMVFLPIIQRLENLANIDPIHLGVIVVVTLAMGLITPPYGLCLLIACGIGKASILAVCRELVPLWIAFISIIALIVVFPDLTLFLPRLFLNQ
jgi:tripartite ATP-independent transporter DctM subunit